MTRAQFRKEKQNSESFSQYSLRLKNYLCRWVECSKIKKSYDELFELLVKDQLLSAISSYLAAHLMEKNLFENPLSEIITIADNFQSIHASNYKVPKYKDKNVPLITNKSKLVYTVNDRYSKVRNKKIKCFNCGGLGHISRNCKVQSSNFVKDEKDSNRVCFNCKVFGYSAKFCTKPMKKIG